MAIQIKNKYLKQLLKKTGIVLKKTDVSLKKTGGSSNTYTIKGGDSEHVKKIMTERAQELFTIALIKKASTKIPSKGRFTKDTTHDKNIKNIESFVESMPKESKDIPSFETKTYSNINIEYVSFYKDDDDYETGILKWTNDKNYKMMFKGKFKLLDNDVEYGTGIFYLNGNYLTSILHGVYIDNSDSQSNTKVENSRHLQNSPLQDNSVQVEPMYSKQADTQGVNTCGNLEEISRLLNAQEEADLDSKYKVLVKQGIDIELAKAELKKQKISNILKEKVNNLKSDNGILCLPKLLGPAASPPALPTALPAVSPDSTFSEILSSGTTSSLLASPSPPSPLPASDETLKQILSSETERALSAATPLQIVQPKITGGFLLVSPITRKVVAMFINENTTKFAYNENMSNETIFAEGDINKFIQEIDKIVNPGSTTTGSTTTGSTATDSSEFINSYTDGFMKAIQSDVSSPSTKMTVTDSSVLNLFTDGFMKAIQV